MNDLIIYQSFFSKQEAEALHSTLEENNIQSSIIETGVTELTEYLGKKPNQFGVQILVEDKTKVDEVIKGELNLEDISSHPFFTYSDDELKDIIFNKDEWNINEVTIAELTLKKRGIEFSPADVQARLDEKTKELSQPQKGNQVIIISCFLGTIISLLLFGLGVVGLLILGTSIGIGVNYHLNKKTLPNGSKVYEYDEKTRKFGLSIIIFNILTFIGFCIYIYSIL